jgi:hypothetical protein
MSHHVAWIAAILVLLLVLTRRRDAGPVHVVKRSPAVAAGVLLAGAGVLVWARGHRAPAAAPRPPAVTRTVTREVTRYVPLHNWPVSGAELTVLGLAALAAVVLIAALAGRYFGR